MTASKVLLAPIEPGTTLTLRYLAAVLGTSVMPIREAIARLSDENVLLVQPNCGIGVPLLDADAADEVWDLRLQLEAHAYRLAAEREKQQDLAAFRTFVNSVNGARA